MTAGCLDESAVLAFLEGTLLATARVEAEAHLAACRPCTELVMLAATDRDNGSVRLPGHEGRPFVGQLQPGARWGRYQVLGAVGRGGMGEVYAAYHPDLDRRIALKVVYESGSDTVDRRARLLREARAIARLSHPNVVTVHDAGTFEDRVFIAMGYVDGTTVDEWLRAAPRGWREILDVFIAAGRGLAAAHAADVIHRDFKPQNVMIGRNGAVRVMDFGLARMGEEETGEVLREPERGHDPARSEASVTKTGAIVGTPAYMSPEQFRRERIDARTDQFSFCVALHEALFGSRPRAARADAADAAENTSPGSRPAGVPGWLRGIILRGASVDREERYRSMDALIARLERGRTRLRRRATVAVVGLATLLLSAGAFRLGYGNRFACAVPEDHVAGAWSGDAADPRRQSIHRAFAASGRATAETSWQRLSDTLDDYMKQWRAMYLQTCEATHVRGEQSAEVLDLRMSCLNDNLDQVHALTDALATADTTVVARAVSAAKGLTPINRCADVALLKSAVPLPKDEKTLREVLRLRRQLAEVEAMREVGKVSQALANAFALRDQVRNTGYKPLWGELLETIGLVQSDAYSTDSTKTLEEAFYTAESAGDDPTAARAAAMLISTVGGQLGEYRESERWFRLANAILDRLGTKETRTRAWALNNWGAILASTGRPEEARQLLERAVALKEASLGPDHPDVAISLDGLGWTLVAVGRPSEALEFLDRAISIHLRHSDPANPLLGNALSNRGDALRDLGRLSEARLSFERALEILRADGDTGPFSASALCGLGETELALGQAIAALPTLERAVTICANYPGLGTMAADAQFALARALWHSGGNRQRARHFADVAHKTYVSFDRTKKARACADWLSAHGT